MPPTQEISMVKIASEPEPILVLRHCPAKASDVVLQFQSVTDREFLIRIEAPNGEKSEMLHFTGAGKLHRFNPKKAGCGHGQWEIEVFRRDKEGNYRLAQSQELTGDGTGSLFLEVGDSLNPQLVSQNWKHLPKNASCRKYSFYGDNNGKS